MRKYGKTVAGTQRWQCALCKQTGIKMWGATFGLEYKPTDNSYVRFEARQLQFDDAQAIFWWDKKAVANRMEMMFHMGISF